MTSWQHIVVDGGSTDSSIQILREFYAGDPRLVLVESPGLGLYASVIKGISLAESPLIGWQNADDVYTSWAFQSVLDFQLRTGANWITGLPGCWDANGILRYIRPYGWYPSFLIRRGWFHADLLGFLQQESMFFTKTAWGEISAQALEQIAISKLAGDFLAWRNLAKTQKLQVLPTVLSGFRSHQENRSHADLEVYMREVRAFGGVFFPRPVSGFFRSAFRAATALSALRRVEAEDICFQSQLSRAKGDTSE